MRQVVPFRITYLVEMHPHSIRLALPAEEAVRLVGVEVGFQDEFVADVDEVLYG